MALEPEATLRRSLRRWRIATGVCLLLVVSVVVLAIYAIIDQAITLTYHDSELQNLRQSEALLEEVALHISTSTTKAELLELVRKSDPDAFEKEGGIHANLVSFDFTESGTLACITSHYPPDNSPCAAFAKQEH